MIYTYRVHKPGEPTGFTYEPISAESVGLRIKLPNGAMLDIRERDGGVELWSPTGTVIVVPQASNAVLAVPTTTNAGSAAIANTINAIRSSS